MDLCALNPGVVLRFRYYTESFGSKKFRCIGTMGRHTNRKRQQAQPARQEPLSQPSCFGWSSLLSMESVPLVAPRCVANEARVASVAAKKVAALIHLFAAEVDPVRTSGIRYLKMLSQRFCGKIGLQVVAVYKEAENLRHVAHSMIWHVPNILCLLRGKAWFRQQSRM